MNNLFLLDMFFLASTMLAILLCVVLVIGIVIFFRSARASDARYEEMKENHDEHAARVRKALDRR